jgi:hypothetical protein
VRRVRKAGGQAMPPTRRPRRITATEAGQRRS